MSKTTILVIEDEADIRELLQYNLGREGYQVLAVGDGESGLREARRGKPDLIVLDLMLPGMQGLEVCRLLRERPDTRSIPVIVLTAKADESDVILGLELGADDYIGKPFSVKELVARVRAVLRRASPASAERRDQTLQVGPIEIDAARHEVRLDGRPVSLTLAEFRLLRSLAAAQGQVMTRDQILDHITDGKTAIIDRNVDVHVRSIRKKLGRAGRAIETVRGVGYRCQWKT